MMHMLIIPKPLLIRVTPEHIMVRPSWLRTVKNNIMFPSEMRRSLNLLPANITAQNVLREF